MEPEIRKLKKLHDFYRGFDYTGLTTKMLARELGVSIATISRWLSGKMRPSERHLRKISQFLEKKGKEVK